MTRLRSLLFVPGDRPDRFAKAADSGADAVILDLEDSVLPDARPGARRAVADWCGAKDRSGPLLMVRINPISSGEAGADVEAIRGVRPDAIMLPKAEGAATIRAFDALWGTDAPPLLPIATETPAAIFELGTYREVAGRLIGLTWGAEDLPAAIGASAVRRENGRFTAPYETVRSLALFAAHAAGVPAIETVFTDLSDADLLERYVGRARCDGFTGMMALHPRQITVINAGFTPGAAELTHARAVIAAFAAAPDAGAIRMGGRMLDRPHLIAAQRIVARAG